MVFVYSVLRYLPTSGCCDCCHTATLPVEINHISRHIRTYRYVLPGRKVLRRSQLLEAYNSNVTVYIIIPRVTFFIKMQSQSAKSHTSLDLNCNNHTGTLRYQVPPLFRHFGVMKSSELNELLSKYWSNPVIIEPHISRASIDANCTKSRSFNNHLIYLVTV